MQSFIVIIVVVVFVVVVIVKVVGLGIPFRCLPDGWVNKDNNDDDANNDDNDVGNDAGSAAEQSCSQDRCARVRPYELGIAQRAMAKAGCGRWSRQKTQQPTIDESGKGEQRLAMRAK